VDKVLWPNKGSAVVDGVTYLTSGKMIAFLNDLSFWKVRVKQRMKALFNGHLQSEADDDIPSIS